MRNQKEWSKNYYLKNKEKIKNRSKKRREDNPNYNKEYCSQWRKNNPEYNKQYYQNNIEKERERGSQWYKNNTEKVKENNKRYREVNHEKIIIHDREYHQKNKEKDKKNHKEWLNANPDYYKNWREKNKERLKQKYNQEYHNQYRKIKRKNNPKYKLDENIGWMVWHGLKNNKNHRRWVNLVGYSRNILVKHLEKQFTSEMNWENYGNYWVVDHIIPRSVFNFTKPEDIDFKRCWALDNLRPLPKIENIKKGAKLIKPFQPSLRMEEICF
jgi:hypothetical protein